MNIILFSKDRPPQLDLLLRSIFKYFEDIDKFKIKVLYTFSNSYFESGYKKLIDKHKDVYFLKENHFKTDLLSLVDNNKLYTVFFVDDNIFKENFSMESKEFKTFQKRHDVVCLSLRLHSRLTFCYSANIPQNIINIDENGLFDWRGKVGDYGYPMSLDGHIFRTEFILQYLIKLDYRNPNSLEGSMACNPPVTIPYMICFNKSIIFNNPINKVQTNNPNRHGDITAEFLNREFLNNKELDLSIYEGFENISCHQEREVKFI